MNPFEKSRDFTASKSPGQAYSGLRTIDNHMARSQDKKVRSQKGSSRQSDRQQSVNSEVRTHASPLKAVKRPAKMPKLELDQHDDDVNKVNVREFIKQSRR